VVAWLSLLKSEACPPRFMTDSVLSVLLHTHQQSVLGVLLGYKSIFLKLYWYVIGIIDSWTEEYGLLYHFLR
jgi:hypothetical protein